MSFGLTAIVFPYGKKQIYILNPSYTSSTYSYEVNFDFNVIEEFERKQNGDQALALFQRDLEMSLSESCIILEEEPDGIYYETIKGFKDSSTFLVDEYYQIINLVHDFSSSTLPTTTIAHEDDNWVKGFCLLVPSKEQEAPTLTHGDFMREPPCS